VERHSIVGAISYIAELDGAARFSSHIHQRYLSIPYLFLGIANFGGSDERSGHAWV
jgi:hypothetical protein